MKAPKNEPIDLDMDAFKGPAKEKSNVSIDQEENSKLDLEIINSCMERHSTFHTVMQRRMANIKVVQNYIVSQNNIASALNALNMIKDPTVSMDVLNATFARNRRLDLLNLDKVS